MTGNDVYLKILEGVNKNNSNSNLPVDKPRIVSAVNEAQLRYMEGLLERKSNDELRLIQHFIMYEQALQEYKKTKTSHYYSLPDDYFDLIALSGYAQQDKCIDKVDLWEIKGYNRNELIKDSNNEPSFYYRESFYTLGRSRIRIYKKDFKIVSASLDYYRYPKKIDIEGYTDENGNISSNQDPEWKDREMNHIIDITVKNLNINSENLNRLQPDLQKINQKK